MESACTKKEPEGSFSHAEVRRMSDVPISILTGGRRPSFIFSRSRFAAAFCRKAGAGCPRFRRPERKTKKRERPCRTVTLFCFLRGRRGNGSERGRRFSGRSR